jgi:uncharacterized MnhB-related membrane protein
MTTLVLSLLALGLALFALRQRRLLWGVVGVGAHSLALAGVYLSLAAPDVALAEAAIGFGLVTFVYLLALRRAGRLVVAATPTYPLLYQEGERVAGLEWEILKKLAQRLHRDLEVLWVPREEIPRLLAAEEADLAAGGFLPAQSETLPLSRPLVPTRLVEVRVRPGPLGAVAGDRAADALPRGGRRFEDEEALLAALARGGLGGALVDLLRFRDWHLRGKLPEVELSQFPEELSFHFAVAPGEEEAILPALEELLDEMERSGALEDLLRRYLG